MRGWFRTLMLPVFCLGLAWPAAAQAPADDPDRDPNNAQPDFYVATLPTTLRMPVHKMSFRLSHRFLHTLGDGDFSDLLSRFFGFDGGAQIGLELRYGLFKGAQVGVYRTSDRTIQFFGQYDIRQQKPDGSPIGVDLVVNVDGTDNFSDQYSPGVALVLSREVSDRAALYVEPAFIGNTNQINTTDDDHTVVVGLGTRVRVAKNTFLFLEGSPRIAGYKPAVGLISFGIEKRAGGHMFQLNFSNGFATTLAQVARGGTANDDWYIGFNLSRKFF
ncbi:MAG: DUF5777 family beta-barrel protein [Vicinamibacterales bacterium]